MVIGTHTIPFWKSEDADDDPQRLFLEDALAEFSRSRATRRLIQHGIASGIKSATLSASVTVKLITPLVECTQALKVGSTIEAGGKITASSAKIGGIEVTTHKHGNVSTGSGTSGGPQ